MKKILFNLALVLSLALCSCSGGKMGEIVIDKDNCEYASCDAGDFFEIQKGTYPIVYKNGHLQVTLPLMVSETLDKSDLDGYKFDGFYAEMYDADDKSVETDDFIAMDGKAKAEKLYNASVGDVVKVTFIGGSGSKDELKQLAKTIKSTFVSIDLDEVDDTDSDDSYDSEEPSKGSADIDKMLDKYETFVDKYVDLVKKAKNGDVSAMSKYAEMLESAEELSEELDDCDGDMNSSQLSRYTRITNKMATAAM